MKTWYFGALVLAALVLGGGTAKGLGTVHILELAALPALAWWAMAKHRSAYGALPMAIVALGAFAFALQLAPLALLGLSDALAGGIAISRDLGRTWDSLAFFATAAGVFLALGKVTEASRDRLVAFLLLGVVLNAVLALAQFAAAEPLRMQPFGFRIDAGFFANTNHFSSLLLVSIPFFIYQFHSIGRPAFAVLPVAAIVFVEFAAGSTAGIVLSLVGGAFAWALIVGAGSRAWIAVTATAVAGALAVLGNLDRLLDNSTAPGLDRVVFATHTLEAIARYWPLGSGFGTFPIVYAQFEQPAEIYRQFVNHAHNDLLELVLEGGLLSALAFVGYLVAVIAEFTGARHSPLRRAALCAIAFLGLHSLVDYPMRTMALASTFALANALYFARPAHAPNPSPARPRSPT